jgi:hypothetical protein
MMSLILALFLLQQPSATAVEEARVLLQQAIDLLTPAPEPEPEPPPPPPYVLPAVDSQAALDAVVPGTVVHLDPALTYPALTLRGTYTLTTLGYQPWTTRPEVAPTGLALVPYLVITPTAVDVTIRGLEISSTNNDLVFCDQGAQNVVLENVYIHGHVSTGAKNGISFQCVNGTVRYSYIDDIFRTGQETHGIYMAIGPGPYTIEDNFIRAASIGIMSGGADPSVANLVPSNLSIRRNIVTKKIEWRGAGYAVKNILELKNARDVVIADNVLQYSWVDGQTGFGIVLTVRNQSGTCTWCIIENVALERNLIRDVSSGVQILARDNLQPSQVMRNVRFTDNTFENINQSVYGGRGTAFEISAGPEDLTIEGTTINSPLTMHSVFMLNGNNTTPMLRLIVRNNPRLIEGSYGAFTSYVSVGNVHNALTYHAPGYVWEANTVQRSGIRTITWPAGTTLLAP